MKRLEAYGVVVPLALGLAGCAEWHDWAAREQDGGLPREDAAVSITDAGAPVTRPEAGAVAGEVLELTLVSWIGRDAIDSVATSHEILVLDEGGAPWAPEIRTRSQAGSGRIALRGLPAAALPSLHVIGRGTGPSDSLDAVLLHYDRAAGMPFVALPSNGTIQVAQTTSQVVSRADHAAL